MALGAPSTQGGAGPLGAVVVQRVDSTCLLLDWNGSTTSYQPGLQPRLNIQVAGGKSPICAEHNGSNGEPLRLANRNRVSGGRVPWNRHRLHRPIAASGTVCSNDVGLTTL